MLDSNYYNSPETDEVLSKQAQEGDRRAEEILAARCSGLVKSCSRPYFLAGGDSEDLIQEGMLGLVTAIRSFDGSRGVPFAAYARICIHSRIQSAIRMAASSGQQVLNQSESISEAPLGEDSQELSPLSDPAVLIISMEEQREMMEQLSQRLSEFEQRVLGLFLEGLSYQDMAKRLGRSVKSVDNAIQRVRRKAAEYAAEEKDRAQGSAGE